MNKVLKENGHGSHSPLVRKIEKKPASAAAPAQAVRESRVNFKTADGVELHGTPVRVTRHMAVFELFNPNVSLQFSEALDSFEIFLQEQKVYSGRATVCNVVNAGTKTICEATLNDDGWTEMNLAAALQPDGKLDEEFRHFLSEWQKLYKVLPEFKVVIADMQTFFHDLRQWLERVELRMRAVPQFDREKIERKTLFEIGKIVIPFINTLFENFESTIKNVPEEHRLAHGSYMRRHLHHLVLSAPFAQRTFEKPLGYAGDYEMVNMILRNDFEGGSLFAKILHAWFVQQAPAEAHRNRIEYLTKAIMAEALRAAAKREAARVYCFACGPAVEIQGFMQTRFNEDAEFTLADFNAQTIAHVARIFRSTNESLGVRTKFDFEQKSVFQLLKDHGKKSAAKKPVYDMVYCAGLFDYLPDDSCTRLMEIFYEWLVPDGVLIVTNVAPSNPMRHGMENLLDWHLIYRGEPEMRGLWRDRHGEVCIRSDRTGVNLFMEIRKRDNV
jgi:extracellular factor (EF) 3-hydroxypalmitic acid methyl ester biosynthesis protein